MAQPTRDVDRLLTSFNCELDLGIQEVNDVAPGVKVIINQFYIGAYHFGKLINILYLLE